MTPIPVLYFNAFHNILKKNDWTVFSKHCLTLPDTSFFVFFPFSFFSEFHFLLPCAIRVLKLFGVRMGIGMGSGMERGRGR